MKHLEFFSILRDAVLWWRDQFISQNDWSQNDWKFFDWNIKLLSINFQLRNIKIFSKKLFPLSVCSCFKSFNKMKCFSSEKIIIIISKQIYLLSNEFTSIFLAQYDSQQFIHKLYTQCAATHLKKIFIGPLRKNIKYTK